MRDRRWVRAPKRVIPTESERAKIIATCDKFVAEVLKPRFVPTIRPAKSGCLMDIYGKWSSGRYRFVELMRSDSPDALEPEFEYAFARLDYIDPDCFDVMWFRHTGRWWRLCHSVSLMEALRIIERDGHLHPI